MGDEARHDSQNVHTLSYSDVEVEKTTQPLGISTLEEKALVRKLDRRILPLACLLCLFAFLDRSNLGNARLQGLPEDVLGGDPSGVLFSWVNSACFLSYVLFHIPATITSKLFPPRLWMASSAIGWGLSSTLMSTGYNFGGLVTARVFLGIFESAFGTAMPLYFSFFYTKAEMGVRVAYWFGFATVAGAFGGLVAFGIQHVHDTIASWRILFITEGVPTMLLGVLTMFLLPDRPESTSSLNEDERRIAIDRMNRSTSGDVGATVNKAHVGVAFRDWRVHTSGIILFALNSALASIAAFLPTIMQTFGHSGAISQLLTVPPYAVAAVILISFSYMSDKLQTRGIFIIIATCIAGTGYLLLLIVTSNQRVRYFATFCITSGSYTTIGTLIAWLAHNLGSETKRATGMSITLVMGHCGSILGSYIFPKAEGPLYTKGFAICCALQFLAMSCAIILTVSYRLENSRRDRRYGASRPNAKVDTSQLADKAPMFRYVP
ncbi:hypothetical protein ONZ45_g10819 [Pleurotus djamor]|nr:hypothetical protein ONZ45_g10819 [Pleurotus djamor]